ncbi:hypothetical protein ACF0H5_002384 [Mactra antiquata]
MHTTDLHYGTLVGPTDIRTHDRYKYVSPPVRSSYIYDKPTTSDGTSPNTPLLDLAEQTSVTKIITYVTEWFKTDLPNVPNNLSPDQYAHIHAADARVYANQITYLERNDPTIRPFRDYLDGDDDYGYTSNAFPTAYANEMYEHVNMTYQDYIQARQVMESQYTWGKYELLDNQTLHNLTYNYYKLQFDCKYD